MQALKVLFVCVLLIGALAQAEPKLYYVHTDHLGTPQVMTDASQQVVWKANYTPFGEGEVDEDPDGDGVALEMPLRFPGQYFDKETGLHYNWHRDYDPTLGRYIQSDPIGLRGGINTYTYVLNNPLIYTDPTGEAAVGCAIGSVAGPVGCGAGALLNLAGLGMLAMMDQLSDSTNDNPLDEPSDDSQDCDNKDKGCPPCNPPVGTIRYRVDLVPPSKPHYPHKGSHVHLYKMNQNPKNCQCFWQPIGTTELPPPSDASPM